MSKSYADHTLSDLLKLKMTWFIQKNPDRTDQIEYICNMVRSNAFKGHLKLSNIFPDYQVPQDIPTINKLYFEYYTNMPTLTVPSLDVSQYEHLAVINKDQIKLRVEEYENKIADFYDKINNRLESIKSYNLDIAHYYNRITEAGLDCEVYKAKLDEPDQIDQKILDEFASIAETEFSIFSVKDKIVTLVSKRPITLGYYNNNVRIEANFGYAFVRFSVENSFVFKEIVFTRTFGISTRHPHVSNSGNICAGDVSHIVTNPEQPLVKRLNAIFSVITTYNPSNPYADIAAFKDSKGAFNHTLADDELEFFLEPDELHFLMFKGLPNACRNGKRESFLKDFLAKNPDNAQVTRLLGIAKTYNANQYGDYPDRFLIKLKACTTYEEVCDYVDMMGLMNYGTSVTYTRAYACDELTKEIREIARRHGVKAWLYSSGPGYTAQGLYMGYRLDTKGISDRANYEYTTPICLGTDEATYKNIMWEILEYIQDEYQQPVVSEDELTEPAF